MAPVSTAATSAMPLVILTVTSVPATLLMTVTAIIPVPVPAVVTVIAVPVTLLPRCRPATPLRRRVTQKVSRATAGVIAATVTAPVLGMTGRHPHIDRWGLLHHRPAPHGLPIKQRRRRSITDIDLAIDARGQLPRNGAADIGLGLGKTCCTGQGQCGQSPKRCT